MDALQAALVLFVASLLQVSVLAGYSSFRSASIVLVALLSVALLRGSVFGAIAGFGTGRCSTPRRSGRSASRRCC